MGTTLIVMYGVKLFALGSAGCGIASALKYFHNFEFKGNKGGNKGDAHIESLHEKARSIS